MSEGKVIDITDRLPQPNIGWRTSRVVCCECMYLWVAVYDVATDPYELECSQCHHFRSQPVWAKGDGEKARPKSVVVIHFEKKRDESIADIAIGATIGFMLGLFLGLQR